MDLLNSTHGLMPQSNQIAIAFFQIEHQELNFTREFLSDFQKNKHCGNDVQRVIFIFNFSIY